MIQGTRSGLGQIPVPCRCSSAGSPALCFGSKIFCPSYSWKWFRAITWNLCYDNLALRWQRLPGGLKKICCFGGSWETAAPADCTELSQASGQGESGLSASSLARKGTAWAALQMQSHPKACLLHAVSFADPRSCLDLSACQTEGLALERSRHSRMVWMPKGGNGGKKMGISM